MAREGPPGSLASLHSVESLDALDEVKDVTAPGHRLARVRPVRRSEQEGHAPVLFFPWLNKGEGPCESGTGGRV